MPLTKIASLLYHYPNGIKLVFRFSINLMPETKIQNLKLPNKITRNSITAPKIHQKDENAITAQKFLYPIMQNIYQLNNNQQSTNKAEINLL
jgi:hypothetical protein